MTKKVENSTHEHLSVMGVRLKLYSLLIFIVCDISHILMIFARTENSCWFRVKLQTMMYILKN